MEQVPTGALKHLMGVIESSSMGSLFVLGGGKQSVLNAAKNHTSENHHRSFSFASFYFLTKI